MSTYAEEVRESASILTEALVEVCYLLRASEAHMHPIRTHPVALSDAELADLFAAVTEAHDRIRAMQSTLESTMRIRCSTVGPIVTSDGQHGWKATRIGHASRMGGVFRLDPLGSIELGELT